MDDWVEITRDRYLELARAESVFRRVRMKLAIAGKIEMLHDAEREYDEAHGLVKENEDAA